MMFYPTTMTPEQAEAINPARSEVVDKHWLGWPAEDRTAAER